MTNEKAKEFFSAYYEGSLDSGLCISFEQKLKADSHLKQDYDAFVHAMEDLDILKFEQITIPEDLHEKISARLDRHIYEQKRKPTPVWGTWVRGFAFAGIGAIAIMAAIMTLGHGGGNGPSQSSIGVSPDQPPKYTVGPDGVTVQFKPSSVKALIVTNSQGKEMSRSTTGNPTLLSNPLPNAAVFGVQIAGERDVTYIAIPGKMRSSLNKGDGTLVEFAKAASDYFRLPVSLENHQPTEHVSWMFTSVDTVAETSKSLGPNYQVTLTQDNMLEIK